jgi:hypothetical protein
MDQPCRRVEWVSWEQLLSMLDVCSAEMRIALRGLPCCDSKLPILEYRYGDAIVESGEFHPPCDSRHCSDCNKVANLARYASIPLSLVLDGCAEIFLDYPWHFQDGRRTPLGVLGKGELYGVFEVLDLLLGIPQSAPMWNVSAGVRSVWVMAPLGNANMLRTLLGDGRIWDDHSPHWQLVRAVTAKRTTWKTRIVLLPQITEELLLSERGRIFFRNLLQVGWKQSAALRHVAVEDARLHERLKDQLRNASSQLGELYQFVTIKHWINILKGDTPAFQPMHRFKEEGGPFSEFAEQLSHALVENATKFAVQYTPVLLRPGCLKQEGDAGYYSFRCPSLLGPKMPTVKAYSQLPSDFAVMIGKIKDEWASKLKPPTLKYFVQPPKLPTDSSPGHRNGSEKLQCAPAASQEQRRRESPFEHVGVYYADDLAEQDLAPTAVDEKVHLYWGSPFFVSGVRLSR